MNTTRLKSGGKWLQMVNAEKLFQVRIVLRQLPSRTSALPPNKSSKPARCAMHKKTSPDFVGYWQRTKTA